MPSLPSLYTPIYRTRVDIYLNIDATSPPEDRHLVKKFERTKAHEFNRVEWPSSREKWSLAMDGRPDHSTFIGSPLRKSTAGTRVSGEIEHSSNRNLWRLSPAKFHAAVVSHSHGDPRR